MDNGFVGAGILEVITESLYDKPIVVFREYIQNAADSFCETNTDRTKLAAHMWLLNDCLYFLDNGAGIDREVFQKKMIRIAGSTKVRGQNIGYKGIGRLSGLPYCRNLVFYNIVNYKKGQFQKYEISGEKYEIAKKRDDFSSLSFEDLMNTIGSASEDPDPEVVFDIINGHKELFEYRNTGFLVCMENISTVLKNTIQEKDFFDQLNWLLPVPFREELLKDNNYSELFSELGGIGSVQKTDPVAARSYNVFFDGKPLYRPLATEMFRTYLCKCELQKYAVCVYAFSNKKVAMDKSNPFSGIRIYFDNMLLCDENELIPALQHYGFTNHGLYELIQSVRGMGAVIYVVDKVSISTNARRTFIDVTDSDSLEFLQLLGEFVENIYQVRYALSAYYSQKKRNIKNDEKVLVLKLEAEEALKRLAREELVLDSDSELEHDYEALTDIEKKKAVKSRITKEIKSLITRYLTEVQDLDIETCISDFKKWMLSIDN